MRASQIARIACAACFIIAGAMHFVIPTTYVEMVPDALPSPELLVAVSGLAEIAGGIGLLIPRLRRAASIGLVALLAAVFPANVSMLVNHETVAPSVPVALLWLRLPLQLLLGWWVWQAGRAPLQRVCGVSGASGAARTPRAR